MNKPKKPIKPMSALLLKIWHAMDTSVEPRQADGQSVEEFMAQYDRWLISHEETARLIHYLGHKGINFNAKCEFMAMWGLA